MAAGGQFNRLKSWAESEVVLNTDLNAEFNNIITSLKPSLLDDYSLTVSQMQETLNPGTVGSETQATTLAEELKQLRYQMKAITGGDQWYSPPDISIEDLNSLFRGAVVVPDNRVVSGKQSADRQPVWLDPAGSSAGVRLDASTDLLAYVNGVLRTFADDISLSGLSTAPASNNTCLVNHLGLFSIYGNFPKVVGETDFVPDGSPQEALLPDSNQPLAIDTIGTEITNLNGKTAAFKVVHGGSTEYFIGDIDTTNGRITNCRRGFFFDSTQAWVPRIAIEDNDVITLLKLTWVFGIHDGTTASLGVTYNQPVASYDAPTSPATGDYWLDLANRVWKKYSGAGWDAANAVFLGWTAQDSSNCIAARAADYFKPYSPQASIKLERLSATKVRTKQTGMKVSVYGTQFYFENHKVVWDSATDTEDTLLNNVPNYLYITDQGDVKMSPIPPWNRLHDLYGYYHPAKPWRAVGYFQTDASGNVTSEVFSYDDVPTFVDNLLYNADFTYWQRVPSSTTIVNATNSYVADRWHVKNSLGTNGVITVSKQSASLLIGAACKLLISTAPTLGQTNGCELYQSLPNEDSKSIRQNVLSFRCYVKAFGNVSSVGVQFYYKSTEGKVDTAIGSEVTVSVNTASNTPVSILGQQMVGPNVLPNSCIGIRIRIAGVSTGNTYDLNNGFQVEQCMMNSGSKPGLFQTKGKSPGAELLLCQRFYEKSYALATAPGTTTDTGRRFITTGAGAGTNASVVFRVAKKAAPTMLMFSPTTGTVDKIRNYNAGADQNATYSEITEFSAAAASAGAAAGDGLGFHYTADCEI